jgi:hypothetical protein
VNLGLNRQRSPFVTRIAWLFIVLSALGSVITALQGVLVFTGFFGAVPATMRAVAPGVQLVLLGVLCWSIGMLLTSLALLRRRPWAHRAFSGLISLCFVVLAGTLVLGLLHPNPLPSDAGGNYLLLLRITEAVSLVFPLLVCAGLLWIWIRMQRLDVRSEFNG